MTTTLKRKRVNNAGDVSLFFNTQSQRDSIFFTIGSQEVHASFFINRINYQISTSKNLVTTIAKTQNLAFKRDVSKPDFLIPKNKPSFDQKNLEALRTLKSLSKNASLPTEIDMMIIYSNEFANALQTPSTRLQQAIDFTNDAFDRSGILININLVHSAAINFNNAENINSLLNKATEGNAPFQSLASLRNQHYADIVAIVPTNDGNSVGGIAWVHGDLENYSFMVSQLPPNSSFGNSIFAHEVGHLLGSGHAWSAVNPSQTDPCDDAPIFTSYSCGHGITNGWGTIMTYLDDAAVGHLFSNPNIQCDDGVNAAQPCGIAAGSTNAADNASSFNLSRFNVAAFRQRPTVIPPSENTDELCLPIKTTNGKFAIICL